MANNKKIFLDINVVIDFLEHSRKRHAKTVALIEYLTNNDYNICISEDMLTTIYYISTNKKAVLLFLKTIVTRWQILHFGEETIRNAIAASLEKNSDLEDSLQCFCAAANGCNTLITHDKTFYDCGIEIYSAGDFLEREKHMATNNG
jgi:predicted nucleic acid-binding protein